MHEYQNDFDEVLGNNNRSNSTNSSITSEKIYNEKFGGMVESRTETSSSLETTGEENIARKRQKLKKKTSKAYFLSQAADSGSDEDEYEGEAIDEYDSKDSIIDQNDYTHNG